MTKKEMSGTILLIIVVAPVIGAIKLVEFLGWPLLIAITFSIIAIIVFGYRYSIQKKRSHLLDKYGDEELVELLMQGNFWQGQTSEQLIDSLGEPKQVDRKVLKTKKKEIWKYSHQGSNRYGLRITLDNDLVVGWDQKH